MDRRSRLYGIAYFLLIVIPLCCGLAVVGAVLPYSLKVNSTTKVIPLPTERPPAATRSSRTILPSSFFTASVTAARLTSTPPISQSATPRPPTVVAPSPTKTLMPTTPAVIQIPTATQLPTVQSASSQVTSTSSLIAPTVTAILSPTPTNTPTGLAPSPTPTNTPTGLAPSPTLTSTPAEPILLPTQTSTVAASACTTIVSVDDENPLQNQDVTVMGFLACDEQPAAGAPMHATWKFQTATTSCDGVADADGFASCTRTIGDATVGYTVTIEVTFTWQGQTYTDQTSFTPQ